MDRNNPNQGHKLLKFYPAGMPEAVILVDELVGRQASVQAEIIPLYMRAGVQQIKGQSQAKILP